MKVNAFTPIGATKVLAATNSTQSIAIQSTISSPTGAKNIRVVFEGTGVAYLTFGTSAVTSAVATGIPVIGPGERVFAWPETATHVAVILSIAGPSNVNMQLGDGV